MVYAASSESPKRQQNNFLLTVSAILALFTKRAKGKLLKSKATVLEPTKKAKKQRSNIRKGEEQEEWGNGGVWQKEILMGGKCEPLDFSGVIYYDIQGKQMSEIPLRSPRASPLPGYLTRLQQPN